MKISGNIVWREIDGEIFIIDSINERIHELNETASLIFRLINKNKKIPEIVDIILDKYEIDRKTCENDLKYLLSEFIKRGIISEN
ncbi:MAG: PqqD family protein [Elusimicrobiota bacterium]